MRKNKSSRVLLWAVIGLAMAGIGYFFYSKKPEQPQQIIVKKKIFPVDTRSHMTASTPVDTEEEIVENSGRTEDPCAEMMQELADFFRYLDQRDYVKKKYSKPNAYKRFKRIINLLTVHPPVPSGESLDPDIIISNLYHFFRILPSVDLHFIRDVLQNEQEDMESILDMFYRWISLNDQCPDPKRIRPSNKEVFAYAGFFLNTTGGRAYLFRRSTALRLLVSYYSILIVHNLDREGKNFEGIDILPFVSSLREEMERFHDLEFKEEYIKTLSQIENYYLSRRGIS